MPIAPLEVESMIAEAEAGLTALELRLGWEGRATDPSSPLDPAGRLRLWLSALQGRRDEMLRRARGGPSGPRRLR